MNTKTKLEIYIERYCMQHKCTPEEAAQHAIVREVAKFYESE